MGLPIVATDIPGCQGVVEEGASGYLVPVKDSVELADAMLKLCEDADKRRDMGRKGRDIILEGFSSEKVIADTIEIYLKIAATS